MRSVGRVGVLCVCVSMGMAAPVFAQSGITRVSVGSGGA